MAGGAASHLPGATAEKPGLFSYLDKLGCLSYSWCSTAEFWGNVAITLVLNLRVEWVTSSFGAFDLCVPWGTRTPK